MSTPNAHITQTKSIWQMSALKIARLSLALGVLFLSSSGVDCAPHSQHVTPSKVDAIVQENMMVDVSATSAFHQAHNEGRRCATMGLPSCKDEGHYGGGQCVKQWLGWFYGYGNVCSCDTHFSGYPCDLGPNTCENMHKGVCFTPGLHQLGSPASGVDKSLLLSAAHLSSLVYTEDEAARETLCPGIDARMKLDYKNYKVQHGHQDTRLEWGVAHGSYGQADSKLYAIAFRGSFTLANWITNIKTLAAQPDFLKDGYVHYGFLAAIDPHMEELVDIIAKVAQGHTHLLVTGHSLGGALANIFALVIKKKIPHLEVQLVTLGAPRVGSYEFQHEVEHAMSSIHRIVGSCDVVPKVPTHTFIHEWDEDDTRKHRFATMVHAGPQITVGCDTWLCTHHYATDHRSSTYVDRLQKGLRGKDHSLCASGPVPPQSKAVAVPQQNAGGEMPPATSKAGGVKSEKSNIEAEKSTIKAEDSSALEAIWLAQDAVQTKLAHLLDDPHPGRTWP